MHDLKDKTTDELKKMVAELKEQLAQYRFQVANMQLKEVRKIRQLRKDVARLMTAITHKEKTPETPTK